MWGGVVARLSTAKFKFSNFMMYEKNLYIFIPRNEFKNLGI